MGRSTKTWEEKELLSLYNKLAKLETAATRGKQKKGSAKASSSKPVAKKPAGAARGRPAPQQAGASRPQKRTPVVLTGYAAQVARQRAGARPASQGSSALSAAQAKLAAIAKLKAKGGIKKRVDPLALLEAKMRKKRPGGSKRGAAHPPAAAQSKAKQPKVRETPPASASPKVELTEQRDKHRKDLYSGFAKGSGADTTHDPKPAADPPAKPKQKETPTPTEEESRPAWAPAIKEKSEEEKQPREYTVFVGGLERPVVRGVLQNYFEQCGQVVGVRLIQGKNFAFVSYGTEWEAGTSIAQLNQSFLEGNTLSVTHAKQRSRPLGTIHERQDDKDQAQAHEASVPDALEQTNDGDRELMVYDDDF